MIIGTHRGERREYERTVNSMSACLDPSERMLQLVLAHKRKTITLEELEDGMSTRDAQTLYEALVPLLETGTLVPLKNAKGNGSKTAPLFERYRIVTSTAAAHDLTKLHPLLTSTTYLERNPDACDRWWEQLLGLSRWLRGEIPGTTATLRERCWEVFGNEKASEQKGFATCVRSASGYELRQLLDVCDDQPEDLPFVLALDVHTPTSIVISENRDPYLALREGLLTGRRSILGIPIDGVIFGRGNAARQAGGASVRHTLRSMHARKDTLVRYWGDIDREGLAILAALCGTGLVEPLTCAYEAMLDTQGHTPRPSPDGRSLPMPDISSLFSGNLATRIGTIAADGLLLPQEAISTHAILEAMR